MSQVNGSMQDRSTSRMGIHALMLTVLVTWMSGAQAQAPSWSVNPASFQYTMSIVAFLNVDGRSLESTNDKVGAFVGNELRGVASPIYVTSADRYLAYLTVFANRQGEKVTFRIFDSAANKIVVIESEITFEIDGQRGSIFQALSVADPPLSKEADIKQFYFSDADTISTEIKQGNIHILARYDQNLAVLTPAFVASDGARLFLDRTPVESASLTYDFTQPVTFTVLSEDESVKNTYVVEVTNQPTSEEGFSCTNVITPNNDGANDYWIVQDVFKYENWEFMILDVNGRVLHKSQGYQNDWDGTVSGSKLSRGKYYYVIRDPEATTTYRGDILILY